MAEKVTVMVLKVDLQCPCCYKKLKKILCKFPQIRDRVYNDKANTVTITVVCCDPEKLRDKLCCKGSKVIKSIQIVEPPAPKPKPDNKPEKPKETEKPKGKPKEIEKPKDVVQEPTKPDKPKVTFKEPPKQVEKPIEKPSPPPTEKPKEVPKPDPPKAPAPVHTPPPPVPEVPTCGGYPPFFPARTCCGPCSEGYGGGPCYFGYGVPPPPPPPPRPCFEGYYGYGYHDRPCHVTRCDYYFSEENPQSCSIM